MPTTPTGLIELPLMYLRAQLSQCASFQARTEAADAAAALAFIHYHAAPEPADGNQYTEAELATRRPYAVVSYPESDVKTLTRLTAFPAPTIAESGSVVLTIEDDIADADIGNVSEYCIKWGNFIGAVVNELFELAGVADYLAINQIRIPTMVSNHPLASEGAGRVSRAVLICSYDEGGNQ